MRIVILLIITALLPVAWFIAEYRAKPVIRRTLGVVALLWSFGVASLIGALRDFSANSYFTAASKELIEVSVAHLKAGNTEVVIRELEKANEAFFPTYENRARYEGIVIEAVNGMGNIKDRGIKKRDEFPEIRSDRPIGDHMIRVQTPFK